MPAPRLRGFYQSTVRERLMEQFGLDEPAPGADARRRSCSTSASGEAIKQPKFLDNVVEELATITGPAAGAAQGEEVDRQLRAARGAGDRRVGDAARRADVGVPRPVRVGRAPARARLPRASSTKSFDGRGNYSLGVKEQMIFPEINYDTIESIHGMDITFVTTATGRRPRLRPAQGAGHAVPRQRQERRA